jgi:Protein of unknown function (DUF3182)
VLEFVRRRIGVRSLEHFESPIKTGPIPCQDGRPALCFRSHPLVSNSADRPVGWSSVFAERVRAVVLPGYTAFSARDARLAAKRMLPNGSEAPRLRQ